jgi:hypothetical protein
MALRKRVHAFLSLAGLTVALLHPSWVHAQSDCPSNMKEFRLGKTVSCVPEPEDVARAKDKLKDDPRFAEIVKGKWDLIRPEKAKPGEFCGAIFQTTEAMIWLMGPGGEYRGALLRFYGHDIPKPANPDKSGFAKQKITLTQAPDPAQTLTVFNHAYEEFKFGVLSIPVPSLDALVGAIEETQSFKIEIDGRVVFNSAWTDGKRARDYLQKCGQGR